MTTSSSRSHSSHKSKSKPRSRPHSLKKSSGSRKRSHSNKDTVEFYCMRCKDYSPGSVDHYVTEKWGNRKATMAKGFCRDCDGKMSLIVPAATPAATGRSNRFRSHSAHKKTTKDKHSRSKAKPARLSRSHSK